MNNFLFEISNLQDWTQHFLKQQNLSAQWAGLATIVINLAILVIICGLCYLIIKKLILGFVKLQVKKSKSTHDDVILKKRPFAPLAHLVPGLLIYHLTPVFFRVNEKFLSVIHTLAILYILITVLIMIVRVLRSIEYLGLHSEKYKQKPVHSFIQMCVLLVYLIFGILILSILFGKSPLTIFTAFGAGMAIVLLIFKDTILGLVASVQLSVNDMVRLGDWIEVPGYNADGDLIEINLMSVKVRNWDKTVTNVPTYALVSNGFKNWREMQDLGIRRLMQSIYIDVNTIKTVDKGFVQKIKDKNLFRGQPDNLRWSKNSHYSTEQLTTVTNLGLFRMYIESYLDGHPGVSDIYVVVRHLEQTGTGLPLGIYAFSKDVSWKPMQQLQADIFEHFFAIIHEFELSVFQQPGGNDMEKILHLSAQQEC